MKTNTLSEVSPNNSVKSINKKSIKVTLLSLLLFLTLKPFENNAQTAAVVSGTGMAVCASYSFSVASGTTLSPLSYSTQYFACSGVNKEDISFNPQGSTWRVHKGLWSFIPNTTSTLVTLYGPDGGGTPNTPVSLSPNDVLLPINYTTNPDCLQFTLNGNTLPGTYERNSWWIDVQ